MNIFKRIKDFFHIPEWDGAVDELPEWFIQYISSSEEGYPIIGMFNNAYENYPKKSVFPWCMTMTVSMRREHLSLQALPFDHELRKAYEIERLYMTLVPRHCPSHYIGHLICNGQFTIWWYLRKPDDINKFMKEEKDRNDHIRPFTCEISYDPKWKGVSNFIKYRSLDEIGSLPSVPENRYAQDGSAVT